MSKQQDEPDRMPDPRNQLNVVDDLLDRVDGTAPGAIAAAMARSLAPSGAESVEILLSDYEAERLTSLASAGGADGRVESVRESPAGLSYRSGDAVIESGTRMLWVPIVERGNSMGVLGVEAADAPAVADNARRAAALAAHLIASADRYTDAFVDVRERKDLSLPAELQWGHLPPESFASDEVVIAATIEPAYDHGGDAFDYSVADDHVDFAVLDAMGHGLRACLDGLVAVTALRSARRAGAPLPVMATELGETLRGLREETTFATAVFGRLTLSTGALRWLNAGHLPPWIVDRDGSRRRLDGPRRPPAGALEPDATPDYPVMTAVLEPGELLVIMSDGVLHDGDPELSAEAVVARIAEAYAGSPRNARVAVRSVARDILRRRRGQLTDDATLLMLARPE